MWEGLGLEVLDASFNLSKQPLCSHSLLCTTVGDTRWPGPPSEGVSVDVLHFPHPKTRVAHTLGLSRGVVDNEPLLTFWLLYVLYSQQ